MTLDTTRQQMFQAIVEGITHEMTLMLSRLEESGGISDKYHPGLRRAG